MTVDQVREMAARGMTDAEIGHVVGFDRRTVQRFRAKYGITATHPRGKTRRGETVPPLPEHLAPPPVKTLTVAEFLLNKRRATCPICQLKPLVKAMVIDAKKKGERQADIIEYLHVCHRITITPREFASHISGRHDQ